MNVPNKELKAFRDMTPEERSAIVEAHVAGRAEILISGAWVEADNEVILPAYIYRTRPRQLVIPWEHIKPEYKWAAMDEDGDVFAAVLKPKFHGSLGWSDCGKLSRLDAIAVDTTGIDWRESLTARPEGV